MGRAEPSAGCVVCVFFANTAAACKTKVFSSPQHVAYGYADGAEAEAAAPEEGDVEC